MPAKYLISARVESGISNLHDAMEDELWKEHARLTQILFDLRDRIWKRETKLEDLPKANPSLIDVSVELVNRMLRHCNICRWNCRVDRLTGEEHGTCQLESNSRVASYFHHQGEELIFRGYMGSGTIFFTSCNMRCCFCQNGDISRDKNNGILVTSKQVAHMAWELGSDGCHNINWVGGEPTIHLNTIVEAVAQIGSLEPTEKDMNYIAQAKSDFLTSWKVSPDAARFGKELNVAQLCNSNFFVTENTMRILRGLIDIWLPDFKFGPGRCAVNLSHTPWYWETVTRNHEIVHTWNEDIVIRHLIMPNHVECCTKPVLDWIAKNMPEVPVNIMDQFHPDYACNPNDQRYQERYKELARYPTSEEVLESYRYAKSLGLNFETLSYEKNLTGLRA
ncbi:MAG: 4Fe-4S cluster-binding domain-containing protein [Nitrososphaerota archaeon]|nr:4Fe-4S cluster-binding domain-containing protein [Nitrososphaerota archaeon]